MSSLRAVFIRAAAARWRLILLLLGVSLTVAPGAGRAWTPSGSNEAAGSRKDPKLQEGLGGLKEKGRWVVGFDLDGTLLRGQWDGTWRDWWRQLRARRAAHHLDRWLARQHQAILPLVITGCERMDAQQALANWGYRTRFFSMLTRDGQEAWHLGRKLTDWNRHLHDRWDQKELLRIVDEIVTQQRSGERNAAGVTKVEPFGRQALHRIGIYAERTTESEPIRRIADRLLLGPLEARGVEVVEVAGERPMPAVYQPKKKIAVKIIPYEHSDGLLSFSIVPWKGGKAGAVAKFGVDVYAGDGPNDADVLQHFPIGEQHDFAQRFGWQQGTKKKFFIAPANASWEVGSAIRRHFKWCDSKGVKSTGIYRARRNAAAGVLEGLEKIFVDFRRTAQERLRDEVDFWCGPLRRAARPLLDKLRRVRLWPRRGPKTNVHVNRSRR
jgi:hypothetical protein